MAMRVALLEIELDLGPVHSLKEKRGVLKGLLHRMRVRHEVAAAEVARQDVLRSTGLGFSAVGNDAAVLQRRMQKIVSDLEHQGQMVVVDFRVDIL